MFKTGSIRQARAILLLWLLPPFVGGCFAGQQGQQSGVSDFLAILGQARAKTAAGEWQAAEELWERVVRDNPVDAEFWNELARARFEAGKYREAILAYQHAARLGFLGIPSAAPYAIAQCYARLGDKEQALGWLTRAFDNGYPYLAETAKDEAFNALRNDSRFRNLVGLLDTSNMGRVEGWRYDLHLLVREVKRRAYARFSRITAARALSGVSEERFDAMARKIDKSIPSLTDMQVTVAFMRLMAGVGDGHTMIYGFWERPEFLQTIPVDLTMYSDGMFITAADARFQDLLGAEVLRFGNRTVPEVMSAIDPLVSRDNEAAPIVLGPMRMRNLPLMAALGLIPDAARVTLKIRDRRGVTRDVALPADSGIPSRKLWDGLPAGWKSFVETIPGAPPMYIKNMYKPYWFECLPGSGLDSRADPGSDSGIGTGAHGGDAGVLYFQYNRVANDPTEPFGAFLERMFAFITSHPVRKLVIDLRWNNGGDTGLVQPLIEGLISCKKIDRPGRLFTIISSHRTFSAAQNAATLIERYTHAIFVGEPTGSSPNFIGEEIPFELPYSKLVANVSDRYWQTSTPTDNRMWIAPLIYRPWSFRAVRENRDPALEAILEYPDER